MKQQILSKFEPCRLLLCLSIGILSVLFFPSSADAARSESNNNTYIFIDSLQPECNTPFTDISGTGTKMDLYVDINIFSVFTELSLPFPFTYYGQTYSDVLIGNDGTVTFDQSTFIHGENRQLPTTIPASVMLPYWDSLNEDFGGGVYYETLGTAPDRRLIIQWHDRAHR